MELPLQFPNGDMLLQLLRVLRDRYANARQALSGLPTLELTYEEHVLRDPRVAYRLVSDFMGLETAPVRVHFDRVNPYPLQQMVTNHDAIAAALRDTEFEWMLTLSDVCWHAGANARRSRSRFGAGMRVPLSCRRTTNESRRVVGR